MKKIMLAASALSAFVAAPAFALEGPNTTAATTDSVIVNAQNPAKCNIVADEPSVTLSDDSLTDAGGFARPDVGTTVAAALNAANINAWCTGNNNKVQMFRTALTINTGDAVDGFNQALVYDVAMLIAGATRSDNVTPLEGTSDGKGNGPGLGGGSGITISHFGPTPAAAAVSFVVEPSSTSFAATSNSVGDGPTGDFDENDNRLVAGDYRSTVTIELTPGV